MQRFVRLSVNSATSFVKIALRYNFFIFLFRIYDQGHSVVGLDGVVGPVKDFFQEHNLEYKEDVKDGLVRFSVNFIQLSNERIIIIN